jgi:hypothetical protein
LHQATFDGEVESQTEMATYVLFTVHTDDDDDTDNDDDDDDDDDDNDNEDDTLIFYIIELEN